MRSAAGAEALEALAMYELRIDAATRIAKHHSRKFASSWTRVVPLRAGNLLERARPLVALPDRTICAMTVAPVLVTSNFVLEKSPLPSPHDLHTSLGKADICSLFVTLHVCVEQADSQNPLMRSQRPQKKVKYKLAWEKHHFSSPRHGGKCSSSITVSDQ